MTSEYDTSALRTGELRQDADPNATFPSGMCGSPKKCDRCPSDYLCWQKASDEYRLIHGRTDETL